MYDSAEIRAYQGRRITPADYNSPPGSLKLSQRDQAELERACKTSPALRRDIDDDTEDTEYRIAVALAEAAQ